MSEKSKKKPEPPEKKEEKKKPISIPLPILNGNEGSLDDEMQDLFDEDKVEHRHGHTEPERD